MSTHLSPAQAEALTDIRDRTVYVGRDPGRPDSGSGYAGSTLRKLTVRGLIRRGEYVPGRGRALLLTPAGEAAVAAITQAPGGGA